MCVARVLILCGTCSNQSMVRQFAQALVQECQSFSSPYGDNVYVLSIYYWKIYLLARPIDKATHQQPSYWLVHQLM
jgi:hypothetical protein